MPGSRLRKKMRAAVIQLKTAGRLLYCLDFTVKTAPVLFEKEIDKRIVETLRHPFIGPRQKNDKDTFENEDKSNDPGKQLREDGDQNTGNDQDKT